MLAGWGLAAAPFRDNVEKVIDDLKESDSELSDLDHSTVLDVPFGW